MFKIRKIVTVILILFLRKPGVYGGTATADKYIVNGQQAEPKMFPYQVSIHYYGRLGYYNQWSHGCGGSLINDHSVLTAAHCIKIRDPITRNSKKYDKDDLKVYIGSEILNSDNGKFQDVTATVAHEKFDFSTMRNDIGLIIIEKIPKFTEYVQPISIYSKVLPVGTHMLVSGWGQTSTTTQISDKLLYIWTKTQDLDKCGKENNDTEIDSSKICGYDPMKQTCEGDSGGPVVVRENDVFYQVGIVSYGYTHCEDSPTVYTRLGHHLDWLKQHTDIDIANIKLTDV